VSFDAVSAIPELQENKLPIAGPALANVLLEKKALSAHRFFVYPSCEITVLACQHYEARGLVISLMICASLVTDYCTFVL
jgi:hypothetical protein